MAPTILRTKNLKVRVYPKDHNPPHVHVLGPGKQAKFSISELRCIETRGFSHKELKRLRELLSMYKEILMEAWDEYQD